MTSFHLLSIFPQIFDSYLNESIIKRAREAGLINVTAHDLRSYATDKHHTTDDSPFGGGAGMVMKVDVIYRALKALNKIPSMGGVARTRDGEGRPEKHLKSSSEVNTRISNIDHRTSHIVLLSAKGRPWNQQLAQEYAGYENIILLCGRYEGVDERVLEYVDDEISIGDYVLTGGELGALVILDSIARLLPGVLGNDDSATQESHSQPGVLEYPQYTRPEVFIDDEGNEHRVPEILLSGDHAKIAKWRQEQQKKRTTHNTNAPLLHHP